MPAADGDAKDCSRCVHQRFVVAYVADGLLSGDLRCAADLSRESAEVSTGSARAEARIEPTTPRRVAGALVCPKGLDRTAPSTRRGGEQVAVFGAPRLNPLSLKDSTTPLICNPDAAWFVSKRPSPELARRGMKALDRKGAPLSAAARFGRAGRRSELGGT